MNRMEKYLETILLAMKIDPDSAYEFGAVELMDQYSDILSGANLDFDFDYLEWIFYYPTKPDLEKLELQYDTIVVRWDMLGTNKEYRNMNLTDSISYAIENVEQGIQIIKEYLDKPINGASNSPTVLMNRYILECFAHHKGNPTIEENREKWLKKGYRRVNGNLIDSNTLYSHIIKNGSSKEDFARILNKRAKLKEKTGSTWNLIKVLELDGDQISLDYLRNELGISL